MFMPILMALAAVAEPRIAQPIHADVPRWWMTPRGLASTTHQRPDAAARAPALGYDLRALAFFRQSRTAGGVPRLDYAGYDQPGEWNEAEITALFVRDDVQNSMVEEPVAGLDIMGPVKTADSTDHAAAADDAAVDDAAVDDAAGDAAIDNPIITDAAGWTLPR